MKICRAIMVVLAVVLSSFPGRGVAVEGYAVPPVNICDRLGISPCPSDLVSVLPTATDVVDLNNQCQASASSYDPSAAYQNSPLGTYVIRFYFVSVIVHCGRERNLLSTAENVPATNGSDVTKYVQASTCLGSDLCIADAGWSRSDLFGVAPPICFHASLGGEADGKPFGPIFPPGTTAGFGCTPG